MKIILDKKIILPAAFLVLGLLLGLGSRFLTGKLTRPLPTPKSEITVIIPEGLNILEIEKLLLAAGISGAGGLSSLKIEALEDLSEKFSYEFLVHYFVAYLQIVP